MKICQRCKTDQVQRIRTKSWQVLCKCRKCKYEMYDSLNSLEIESKYIMRKIFPTLLNILCDCNFDHS